MHVARPNAERIFIGVPDDFRRVYVAAVYNCQHNLL